MSTDPTLRSSLSRRRLRTAAGDPQTPLEPSLEPVRVRWQSILTLIVVVGLLVAVGVGLSAALRGQPPAALAGCRTASQLAPRLYASAPAMCIRAEKTYQATIHTTKGDLIVILPAKDAPLTVNNFIVLAVNGYYTGLNFWRNESWVTQTGDPNGSGSGGPGYTLPEEPNNGDWTTAGALGMARPPGGPINGGQFFILKAPWPNGGPGTTVFNHFGTVLQGQELLKTLGPTDRILGITVSVQ